MRPARDDRCDAMDDERNPEPGHWTLHADDLAYLVEAARRRGIVDEASAAGNEVRLRIGPLERYMHPVEATTFLRRALYVWERHAAP